MKNVVNSPYPAELRRGSGNLHAAIQNPLARFAPVFRLLLVLVATECHAQFANRISPDYAPDSIDIQVRRSGLSSDGRWYYFTYDNFPNNLQFYDLADNTRWEGSLAAFADPDPVGIAAPFGADGPHYFLFSAKMAGFPADDPGLWSIRVPDGAPVRISRNVSVGTPDPGVLTAIDQFTLTPDEGMIAYRAIYEFSGGARKPQVIQTYRFLDDEHFVSSHSPLAGEVRTYSFILDPASFRVAYVADTGPGTVRRLFTSSLTHTAIHDLTPTGYRIWPGSRVAFNSEGHRVVFVAFRLPNTGDQEPQIWDCLWTRETFPQRINQATDLGAIDPIYAPNGDILFRALGPSPPYLHKLNRAQITHLDPGQREIIIAGRNLVSIAPPAREVVDFAVSKDSAHAAYRYESPSGDAELHLARTDGSLVHVLTPDTIPDIRIGDYGFSTDGSGFLYYVHSVGTTPTGKTYARRVPAASPGFPATLATFPMGTDVSFKPQGEHFVLSAISLGSFNRLISTRRGTTFLQTWVDDDSPSSSEIIQPSLTPDGCRIFYVRRINGFVDGQGTGAQVWHSRCAIEAFLPQLDTRYLQGQLSIDFQRHLGFNYNLFFADDLGAGGGGAGGSDWTPVPNFNAQQLPWFDNGQPPAMGRRFYRIGISPIPDSVKTIQWDDN